MDEAKLKIEKVSDGQVTCLRMSGTIDEQFDGKKLAGTVKGGTLVLDLGDVRKISSFGCREWVDFVGDAGQRVNDLLLVECAPKVVDQLNMVMNFAGKGRVFSFYAPYRCDYCDVERRVLLQVDRDAEAIRALKPPEQPCEACGNPSYFDEDPVSYFSYVAGQAAFELPAPVASFLASKLSYDVEGAARRFRAEKHVEGRATYLRMSGDLDVGFPADKIAEGLEGTLVVDLAATGKIDPPGAAAWRTFVTQVSATCEQVWLVSCPPMFLERLARAEDLGSAAVVSLTMPYTCQSCAATASHTIDVDPHFDVLKFATAPEVACPDCGGKTVCAASEALLAHLGALPRPNVPAAVTSLIESARNKKPAVAAAPVREGKRPSSLPTVLLATAAAAVVAVAVVVGWSMVGKKAPGAVVEKSATERPAWVETSGCGADGICVGAAAAASAEEARFQAMQAAFEAAMERSVEKLPAEARALVTPLYKPVRDQALAAGGRAALEGRRAVGLLAREVITEEVGDYWERSEQGTRVWARAKVSDWRAEIEGPVYGVRGILVPPILAWRYPVKNGALLVSVEDGPLKAAGVSRGDIVLDVDGAPVTARGQLQAYLEEAYARAAREDGVMRLLVKSGDSEARVFRVEVPKAPVARPAARPATDVRGGPLPTGGVNVWDRTGGGSPRDNPND